MRNKSRYPENWLDTVRPKILLRDGYKCKECGIPHRAYVVKNTDKTYSEISVQQMVQFREQGKQAFRIYLQIAHIDNNPANPDENNLISLCPPCHLKLDSPFKMLLRKAQKAQAVQSLGATPIL